MLMRLYKQLSVLHSTYKHRFVALMNVSLRYWSPFHGNECVFSRNEQQKVYYCIENNLHIWSVNVMPKNWEFKKPSRRHRGQRLLCYSFCTKSISRVNSEYKYWNSLSPFPFSIKLEICSLHDVVFQKVGNVPRCMTPCKA